MADLTVTASQVAFVSGTRKTVLAGATITAGQTVYLDVSAGSYKLAQTDGTAEEAGSGDVGIALSGASSGAYFVIQDTGTITIGAGAAPTVGEAYFVSKTAGGIAPDADIVTTNTYRTYLGIGNSTNTLTLQIHVSGAQVA